MVDAEFLGRAGQGPVPDRAKQTASAVQTGPEANTLPELDPGANQASAVTVPLPSSSLEPTPPTAQSEGDGTSPSWGPVDDEVESAVDKGKKVVLIPYFQSGFEHGQDYGSPSAAGPQAVSYATVGAPGSVVPCDDENVEVSWKLPPTAVCQRFTLNVTLGRTARCTTTPQATTVPLTTRRPTRRRPTPRHL